MQRSAMRRGASNFELLVGMVILSIAAMAVARVVISQTRYFEHQKTAIQARSVPRGPLNRLVSDLRMVEAIGGVIFARSEEHTSELQSRLHLVCRLLLEKKKK